MTNEMVAKHEDKISKEEEKDRRRDMQTDRVMGDI